ncbi:phage baseplate assembly protein V [Fusobacterium ulcerans]|uniref:phage baseplate assembly protein V n=1 Tax=Fusobacterium ulcerans TaxID=861 RepID=UPI0026E9EE1B|nr:phage baseplate assembly protein V [Fusobacterium ulcerans]
MIAGIELGIIKIINEKDYTARVRIPELDNKMTGDLQVLVPLTNGDQEYKMPAVETQVVCLFIGDRIDRGYIIGSYYSKKYQVPGGAVKEKIILKYPGGAEIEIDKKSGVMKLDVIKELIISTPKVTINSDVEIKGKLDVEKETTIKDNLGVGGDTTTQGKTITEGVRIL